MKSRIQDYHGFPLTGRNKGTENPAHFHWQFYFVSKGQPRHEPRFYVLFLDQTFMTLIFYFQPPGQSWRIKPWLFGNLETVQTIRNWDVAKERLLLSFILSKGYKVKFLKSFDKKSDVSDEELEKHFKLEIVRPKNSAASFLNSSSRT